MKIAAFVVNGTEDIELITPIDVWRRAGIRVDLITLEKKKICVLAYGNKICSDMTIDKVNLSQYDALFLPGGEGHVKFKESKKLVSALQKFALSKKWIFAICAAPSILGELDLLGDAKATVFPGYEGTLKSAYLDKQKVVADKNFITAKGAGVSMEFALAGVKALMGEEKRKEIAQVMQFS